MLLRWGLVLALCGLVLGWAVPLRAQPNALVAGFPEVVREACAHVPAPFHLPGGDRPRAQLTYERLLALMAHRQEVPTLTVQRPEASARWRNPTFTVDVRPGGAPDIDGAILEQAWNLAFYTVVVRPLPVPTTQPPRNVSLLEHHRARIARTGAPEELPAAADERRELRLPLQFDPPPAQGWFGGLRRHYEVLVLPCLRATPSDPVAFAPEFGRAEVRLYAPILGFLVGLGVVVFVVVMLGFAAREVNGSKLRLRPRQWWRPWLPSFICQDTYGYMSLSAFQVFLFTLALLGVYAYAFFLTGSPPQVQESVLVLAGITLGGSTLAGAVHRPSLDASDRLWLAGTGVVESRDRLPQWTDMLNTNGQVDITRVQALAFTLFAVVALVVRGAEDLGNFTIPEQLNYLIGLSQGVYVAGKAIPADSVRRLKEELRDLQQAEDEAQRAPEDEEARKEFERLKRGIAPLLQDVFGPRFQPEQLRALQPGARGA